MKAAELLTGLGVRLMGEGNWQRRSCFLEGLPALPTRPWTGLPSEALRGGSSNSNKGSARPGAQTPEGCSVYSTTGSLLSFLLFFGGAAREMLNHSMRLSPR